ncbi:MULTISPECIES: hypothetical protein [Streptomyces]|uniref:hypothetical protein n=1 Tax=Streptomyces TaxID=1883 RepID=UPI001675B297|nr:MULTISPECIES: hypothetical protein [Streptomyces]MBD3575537.1 hypothetical protein [Streptomyces sp. KD18]GGT22181.1 hypothetical protein GCM10010286_54600 [Streptomyces toxytricini]
MTQWFRCYWDEEDMWFCFEVDSDGWVTRQVELRGPHEEPVAAASLAEWEAALADGTLEAYESVFGATAEVPVQEWDGHDPHDLGVDEFEAIWLAARTACRARARINPVSGA